MDTTNWPPRGSSIAELVLIPALRGETLGSIAPVDDVNLVMSQHLHHEAPSADSTTLRGGWKDTYIDRRLLTTLTIRKSPFYLIDLCIT